MPCSFFGGAPGGGEILLILTVLLLLFGAKRLPQMARTLGRTLEEFRRASREATDAIMREADEPDEKTKAVPPPAPDDAAQLEPPTAAGSDTVPRTGRNAEDGGS